MHSFFRLISILLCVVGIAAADEPRFKPEDLKTLEYIARGYEANAHHRQPIRLRGRIFFEQKAQAGQQIAESHLIAPRWLNFESIQKDGKRRYVQDMMFGKGVKRHYALDNDQQIMVYAHNVFRRLPLTNEEQEWSKLTGEYEAFNQLSPAKGDENVARGLRDLVRRVSEEDFLNRYDGRLSVQLDEQGIFTIHLTSRNTECVYRIDSRKGFNLVEMKDEKSGKFTISTHLRNEYAQDAEGKWVLSGGQFTYASSLNGLLQTKKLEVTEIAVGNFECPDSLFEQESLNMPPDIMIEDHHFSPPLIIHRGNGMPTRHNIDKLLETAIASADVATITNQGDVTVQPHQGYVQHQSAAAGGAQSVAAPSPLDGFKNWYWTAGIALLGLVAAALVLAQRRRYRQ